jgi:hypothetical protein
MVINVSTLKMGVVYSFETLSAAYHVEYKLFLLDVLKSHDTTLLSCIVILIIYSTSSPMGTGGSFLGEKAAGA